MRRSSLGTALLIAGSSTMAGQTGIVRPPTITINLPPGLASKGDQINYIMIGEFGGYGKVITPQKGRSTYDFVAGVEGKPARSVKLIAYIPGCEITTLSITVEVARISRALKCKPLKLVHLRGQIRPNMIGQGQPAEIEISYLALWDHNFYGIDDGMVTNIHVATVVPTSAGSFEVDVPDFHSQTLGEDAFQLTLRAAETWNDIAFLRTSGNAFGLAVRSSYPPLVTFRANRP